MRLCLNPLAGQAIELLVGAYQHGTIPPVRVLVPPVSVPPVEALRPAKP